MANFKQSHPLNVPGSLFTDLSCIDCGTCYHLGTEFFKERSDKSVVIKQPHGPKEWQLAKRAILSCPTNSIGVQGAPEDFTQLGSGLPVAIAEGVSYLGFTSRDSFGASSYLIQRSDGNIMVDSPRFHPWIVKEIENRGGVKSMFLTHQDDVADHQKFHEHFGCERIIHEADVTDGTRDCEVILSQENDISMGQDLKIILTPGHTKGHICLLYREKFLFSGDHLFVDQDKHEFRSSRGVCWYSWSEQISSTEKLLKENFQWVLPGHGGWGYFGDNTHDKLQDLISSMRMRK